MKPKGYIFTPGRRPPVSQLTTKFIESNYTLVGFIAAFTTVIFGWLIMNSANALQPLQIVYETSQTYENSPLVIEATNKTVELTVKLAIALSAIPLGFMGWSVWLMAKNRLFTSLRSTGVILFAIMSLGVFATFDATQEAKEQHTLMTDQIVSELFYANAQDGTASTQDYVFHYETNVNPKGMGKFEIEIFVPDEILEIQKSSLNDKITYTLKGVDYGAREDIED